MDSEASILYHLDPRAAADLSADGADVCRHLLIPPSARPSARYAEQHGPRRCIGRTRGYRAADSRGCAAAGCTEGVIVENVLLRFAAARTLKHAIRRSSRRSRKRSG